MKLGLISIAISEYFRCCGVCLGEQQKLSTSLPQLFVNYLRSSPPGLLVETAIDLYNFRFKAAACDLALFSISGILYFSAFMADKCVPGRKVIFEVNMFNALVQTTAGTYISVKEALFK